GEEGVKLGQLRHLHVADLDPPGGAAVGLLTQLWRRHRRRRAVVLGEGAAAEGEEPGGGETGGAEEAERLAAGRGTAAKTGAGLGGGDGLRSVGAIDAHSMLPCV